MLEVWDDERELHLVAGFVGKRGRLYKARAEGKHVKNKRCKSTPKESRQGKANQPFATDRSLKFAFA